MRPALALLALVPPARVQLFFSEYGGSGSNQYLEIYNAGDGAVPLALYGLQGSERKGSTAAYTHAFPKGAVVQAGDVFVICDPNAAPAVLAQCDQMHNFASDEGANYCLVSSDPTNKMVYDCVGDYAAAGAGWDVCGEGTTKDATLVRRSNLTADALWVDSNAVETCEWSRLPQDTFTYIGSHPHPRQVHLIM
ncbi:hypothetical protein M885DRAFT_625294 [Pelagophyceae sp. CCMP2097]|nr:hypothetical protein M885DRAFT_625294 [Pelagophyceae sp. CCMP2097]